MTESTKPFDEGSEELEKRKRASETVKRVKHGYGNYQEIVSLLTHPALSSHFDGQQEIGIQASGVTIEQALEALLEFGDPVLRAFCAEEDSVRASRYVCSIHLGDNIPDVIATGRTPLIATLKCLLETILANEENSSPDTRRQ